MIPLRPALCCAAVLSMVGLSQSVIAQTTTPIKHLIVVVGENTSFDTLFATYQAPQGSSVRNLLSAGIVDAQGNPGPAYAKAVQKYPVTDGKFGVDHPQTTPYKALPRPYARVEKGAPKRLDDKVPADLPAGPFQITQYRAYTDYTDSNPVHRFFQMWQQINGGRNDLFLWAGLTSGEGAKDKKDPSRGTYYGSESMGFYNMAAGDVPYFKQLAQQYAISDNYHQAVMGGTMPNYFFLAHGDVARYQEDGKAATPPELQIENPEPAAGTANWYTNSGYSAGSHVACADESQPGVNAIRGYLKKLPYKTFNDGNCESGAYYLVNNYASPYTFKGTKKNPAPNQLLGTIQTIPNIATQLQAAGVSWKWYHGGRDGSSVKKGEYASDTDPLTFSKQVMESGLSRQLQGDADFFADIDKGLPAVSFISPPLSQTGHPHYGSPANFENYVKSIVDKVQANPKVWEQTAILITYDEGGGYFDSGYVQAVDFFGDGTRIPMIAVSKWARSGHVDHSYYDHASIHKFIQRNWGLKPLSSRSRDNLPNPVHSADAYVPDNRPAVGDLMNLFQFKP